MTTLRVSTGTREVQYFTVPNDEVRDFINDQQRHGASVKVVK